MVRLTQSASEMIVAFAGRRIDAPDAANPAFPAPNIAIVRRRVRDFYEANHPLAVVGSAACGADLLAQQEARALGIPRSVILPFEPARFRETSVVDRPGNWGDAYDRVIAETGAHGELTIAPSLADDTEGYRAANSLILERAAALARERECAVTALLIWEGQRSGGEDLTQAFAEEARRRGFATVELSTL